ncbi:APC family permease [Plantactinospora sp. CA-290183]|uniref:APC family permease n=1 Tax=Plantactinospora sp. CA-290183 TaxID=3240006 RepID=UPI003D929D28
MTPLQHPRSVSAATSAGKLGVPQLVSFILASATLLTVVTAVYPTGIAVTGLINFTAGFAVVGVVLMLWAPGYVKMGRHVPNAGAFYAYSATGLNKPLGVGAAWMALASYCLLQVGLYGVTGTAAAPLMRELGWNPPWWLLAGGAAVLVGGLGLTQIKISGRLLAVLLLAEVAFILVVAVAGPLHPSDNGMALEVLDVRQLFAGSAAGATCALVLLGYVGVEQGAVLVEDARRPHWTVGLATYGGILAAAVLYVLSTWSQAATIGTAHLVDSARQHGPDMYWLVVNVTLGPVAVLIGRVLFLTSVNAATLSFHQAFARYAFSAGRDGVVPRWVAYSSRRTGAPVAGSLIQTVIGLTVITVYAIADLDPLVHLFYFGGTVGGVGILLLITLTSIAIVFFLARCQGARAVVLPLVAALILLAMTYAVLTNLDLLLGVDPDSPLLIAVPAMFGALMVAGVVRALYLRCVRPGTYAGIGQGVRSVLAELPDDPDPRALTAPVVLDGSSR